MKVFCFSEATGKIVCFKKAKPEASPNPLRKRGIFSPSPSGRAGVGLISIFQKAQTPTGNIRRFAFAMVLRPVPVRYFFYRSQPCVDMIG